jgi:hypothetical protein
MRQRPQETLRQLCEIFPAFHDEWAEEDAPPEDGLVDGVYYEWTHHAVLGAFLGYFARNHDAFTELQLRRLGDWINNAVTNYDEIENAVATCFLEHMRQVRIDRVLAPHLSRIAKGKARP